MDKYDALKTYFGYQSFRYPQDEIIDNIMNGIDVIGVLPTGAGKSIIFQVPAILFPGLTLVISPLISLMLDQVNYLKKKNFPVCYLNTTLSSIEVKLIYQKIQANQIKLIYLTPERLNQTAFQNIIRKQNISFIAIDEAHTLAWGKDFRESFLAIYLTIDAIKPRPVVAALTATANPRMLEYIKNTLHLIKPKLFFTTFDRPNLFYCVIRINNKITLLKQYLMNHLEESGVIYCLTKKTVVDLSKSLNEFGYKATYYYGDLDNEKKKTNQILFLDKKVRIMVATISFGMGINMSSIRFVINYEIPLSIADLVQMFGRAGRDGNYAECFLYYDQADLKKAYYLIEASSNPKTQTSYLTRRRNKKEKYQEIAQVIQFCFTKECLHKYICRYFGENKKEKCNNCSNCVSERKKANKV